jgi:hypothetical protein
MDESKTQSHWTHDSNAQTKVFFGQLTTNSLSNPQHIMMMMS